LTGFLIWALKIVTMNIKSVDNTSFRSFIFELYLNHIGT
jgi:hypothetical protein